MINCYFIIMSIIIQDQTPSSMSQAKFSKINGLAKINGWVQNKRQKFSHISLGEGGRNKE